MTKECDDMRPECAAQFAKNTAEHESIGRTLDRIDANSQRIVELLEGNGKPGIRMDVDRLKGSNRRRNLVTWAMFLAILGVLGRLAFQAITM